MLHVNGVGKVCVVSELWEELIVFAEVRGQETGSGNNVPVLERGSVLRCSSDLWFRQSS